MQQYVCITQPQRNVDHLFNLKQNLGDSLWKSIHQFATEMVQAESNDQKAMIVAFIKALLTHSPLLQSLSGLGTMEELLDKANRYANMEEELGLADHKRKVSHVKHMVD